MINSEVNITSNSSFCDQTSQVKQFFKNDVQLEKTLSFYTKFGCHLQGGYNYSSNYLNNP